MRVIVLTHGGAELVLERLAELDNVLVAGVFIESDTSPRRGFFEKIRRSLKYDGVRETVGKFFTKFGTNESQPASIDDATIETAKRLGMTVQEVDNFHSVESIELIRGADADLGIIYGTNIIKENVFSIPKLGSINLHQGLAPYYRGGPPIFWELFNDEPEVGITSHFVAANVDAGDIVLQRKIPLQYDFAYGLDFESFITEFRKALKPESADLIAESVKLIEANAAPRTPQDTLRGKRYRLPTKREKDELRMRLRLRRGENAKD